MRKTLWILAIFALVFAMGCTEQPKDNGTAKAATEAKEKAPAAKKTQPEVAKQNKENVVSEFKPGERPVVVMETNQGVIEIELNPDKAPISVKNFLEYVDSGFYAGTIFHRVINNFMIQGGGFTKDLQRKDTRQPIKNEADNGLKNDLGTVAMARTGVVDSATSQFFINVKNNDFLNHTSKDPRGYGYAVFGKVVSGMDVVNKIKAGETGPCGPFPKDCPKQTVEITKMSRKK